MAKKNKSKPKKGKGGKSYQKVEDEPQQQSNQKARNGRNGKKKRNNSTQVVGCNDYELRRLIEGSEGKREIIEMAADGNCLFRSISHQLHLDYGQRHDLIRHDICKYLEENKEEFSIFLLLDDDEEDVRDFESYVAEMREDGTWGGDVEIVCAARLYQRNVTIFSSSGAYNIACGDNGPSGPDLLLSYHENSHYNSVHDEDSISLHESVSSSTGKSDKKQLLNGTNEVSRDTENIDPSPQSAQGKGNKSGPKRNDLCPCGSNLRYKKCCLAKDKSRIRSEKFKLENGIELDNKGSTLQTDFEQAETAFNILNI